MESNLINKIKKVLTFNPVALPVIIALIAIAVEPIIVKLGYNVSMKPVELLVFRFISAAIVILPFCRNFKLYTGRKLFQLVEVSFLFMITNICIYLALQSLTAITVITIVTTTPAFVALTNQTLGKEKLSKTFWIGFLLCFFGVIVTMDVFNKTHTIAKPSGLFFITLAVIGSTTYRTKMDRMTKEFKPILISNYIFLLNGLAALLFLPFIQFSSITTSHLGYGVWLGAAAVVGNLAFLYALKIVGSTRISIITILQRPLLIIISALVLKEQLGWQQAAGIAMVLLGLKFAKVRKLETEPVEAEQ